MVWLLSTLGRAARGWECVMGMEFWEFFCLRNAVRDCWGKILFEESGGFQPGRHGWVSGALSCLQARCCCEGWVICVTKILAGAKEKVLSRDHCKVKYQKESWFPVPEQLEGVMVLWGEQLNIGNTGL